MKVAVSIPDDVFEEADRLAARTGSSRSAIYTLALTTYIRDRSDAYITEALNDAVEAIGDDADPFATAAARRTFARNAW